MTSVPSRAIEPLELARGWHVLHLFGSAGPSLDVAAVGAAVAAARETAAQVVTASILGAAADVCFLALGADVVSLRRFQTRLQRAGVVVRESYVSVTEVSEYAAGMPTEMLNARLYPALPPEGLRAFCFYPMSKRRSAAHNWYALSFDERDRLMRQHGAVGRTFRGRVLQLVTGSTGLDAYEWGVTLFGAHLDDLKECVYQMRFDEASALYADFGPFYAGFVGSVSEVLALAVGEG